MIRSRPRDLVMREAASRGGRMSLLGGMSGRGGRYQPVHYVWILLDFPLEDEDRETLEDILRRCEQGSKAWLVLSIVLENQKKPATIDDLRNEAEMRLSGLSRRHKSRWSHHFFAELNSLLKKEGIDLRIRPFGEGKDAEIRVWRLPTYAKKKMRFQAVRMISRRAIADSPYNESNHPDDQALVIFVKFLQGETPPEETKIGRWVASHAQRDVCRACCLKLEEIRAREQTGRSP